MHIIDNCATLNKPNLMFYIKIKLDKMSHCDFSRMGGVIHWKVCNR